MSKRKKPIKGYDPAIHCCPYQSPALIRAHRFWTDGVNANSQPTVGKYTCMYCNILFVQTENPITIVKTDIISDFRHERVKPRDIDGDEKDGRWTPAMHAWQEIKRSQEKAGIISEEE